MCRKMSGGGGNVHLSDNIMYHNTLHDSLTIFYPEERPEKMTVRKHNAIIIPQPCISICR